MYPNVLKQINQWIVKTPLRSLSEAYNAAQAIQAIEEKHFAGEAISQTSNLTDAAFSYFRDKRESYLQVIRVRLAEFRTSNLISNLLHASPDKRLSGEMSQDSDESMILEKLSLVESVLARYELQRQLEATVFSQKQDRDVNLPFHEAPSDLSETGSLQRIRSGSVFDTANQIKAEILLILSLFPWTKPLVWTILSLPIKLLRICFVVGLINLLIDALLNVLEKARNDYQIFGSEDEQRKSLRLTTTINVLKDSKMVAIYLIAVICGITILGAPIVSILAASGLLVVALSFSFQGLVRDILTGFLILWKDQFAIGDTIAIQNISGHLTSGLVENMNLRITQLRDLKGRLITIPNSTIIQAENMTRGSSQVDFSVEIAHGADIDQAITVIQKTAQCMLEEEDWRESIVTSPHVLGIDSISHSGLLIRVLIRTKPAQQWRVEREFRRRVLIALSEHNIAIV